MPVISEFKLPTDIEAAASNLPGGYQMKSATIERTGEDILDIGNVILGFGVYEDIMKPYLTCEIACIDTGNIPSRLPITGGEKIKITITDCLNVDMDFEFIVSKVSNRKPVSVSSLSYIIHGVSENRFKSAVSRVSKSFISKNTEEIISDLNFGVEPHYVSGNNDISCMIPNWPAVYAMNFVNTRSSNKNFKDSPFRTFMDRNYNLYHLPIDFLYDQHIVTNIDWNIHRTSRAELDLYRVLDLQIVSTASAISNIESGMYNVKHDTIDFFTREQTTDEYDYVEKFNETKHLGNDPIRLDSSWNVEPESNWEVVASEVGLYTGENPDTKLRSISVAHKSKNIQTENIKIMVKLPGHNMFRVGQKYHVNIPALAAANTESMQNPDNFLTGDYLVSKVKHEFIAEGQRYNITAEMFTDSLFHERPTTLKSAAGPQ